ncbi:serine/threonine-protein kinase [Tahibacter amnicola]|uniref:mitogen-activated protein kinase kinase n=1 Tax=Tahibacter amnicola TaxID=2976241 RepID=A0ABY6BA97_9GAMM|nr:serine/threonine-protein kinase [Tahibacter amnicola]UXI66780.1 serine/threonine-protein kinase [Tahibacter amnicola]
MSGDKNDLERIAAGIADDAALDWRLLARLDGEAGETADGLRELSQLAQVFRGLQIRPDRADDSPRRQFQFAGLDVLEKLAEGANGEVWRAYDPMLDQDVALKLRRLDSDALTHQFLAEARRLAKVRQSNIVSVYGAAEQDGRVGLWTELVRGQSLAEVLASDGPMPVEEVAQIGIQLCRALAAVHRHGLSHGDVKAENVLRDVSGRIVLADFGCAREISGNVSFSTIAGTRHYLAPEVLDGDEPGAASDQYALGVLLYRLLTGTYPYVADDLDALRERVMTQARKPLCQARPEIPRALARAIDRALLPQPAKRHPGVLAMLVAIESAMRPWRPHAAHWIAAAALLVLALTTAMLLRAPAPGVAVDTAFYRQSQGTREQLHDGATIALGDRLRLELTAAQPTWVYVFNDDGAPEPTVLFPLPGLNPTNPLTPGTRWQLPGHDGVTGLSWQVDSEADRDTFVVIASTMPLPLIETRMAQWQYAASPESALVARGVSRLVPVEAAKPSEGESLADLLRRIGCDDASAQVRCLRYVFPHRRS